MIQSVQPIFQDMLDDHNPTNFPFPQGRGDLNPERVYYGAHIPHDGYRPERVLLPEEPRGTWMTDGALQLSRGVANRVTYVAIHGPTPSKQTAKSDEGTYMSLDAINLAHALHRIWLIRLRKKPIS